MGIIRWVSALLRRRKDLRELQARFRRELMPEAVHRTSAYPPGRFLGDQGIYAELLQFHVSSEGLASILKLTGSRFRVPSLTPGERVDVSNDFGESIRLIAWSEFNGIRVDLLTNAKQLLKLLEDHPIAPPPPWEAFPRVIDPDTLGSLQGDIEYWWDRFWSPYWDHLSEPQRGSVLEQARASQAWIDCIETHRSKL